MPVRTVCSIASFGLPTYLQVVGKIWVCLFSPVPHQFHFLLCVYLSDNTNENEWCQTSPYRVMGSFKKCDGPWVLCSLPWASFLSRKQPRTTISIYGFIWLEWLFSYIKPLTPLALVIWLIKKNWKRSRHLLVGSETYLALYLTKVYIFDILHVPTEEVNLLYDRCVTFTAITGAILSGYLELILLLDIRSS